jgi:hypothetical protein
LLVHAASPVQVLEDLAGRPDDLQALPGWREGLTPSTRPLHELRDAPLHALAKPEAWRAHDALFFAAWGADRAALCAERGLGVDEAGFEKAMDHQRAESRKHWKGSGEAALNEIYLKLAAELKAAGKLPKFVGYDSLEAESECLAILVPPQSADAKGIENGR